MKNLLILIALLSFFGKQSIFAQCTENASSFGNNTTIPGYNVTGDVSVTLNTGGQTVSVDLGSNFMTAPGPDINVFLVNSNGMTNAQLAAAPIASLDNILLGLVGSNTLNQNGAKSFTVNIPPGKDIRDYDKAFFYCFQFNQFWDFGTFTSFSDATCSVLSIEDQDFKEIDISTDSKTLKTIILNNKRLPLSINVYSILGRQVANTFTTTNQNATLHLSGLRTGVYLVEVKSEGKRKVQKIIKR